MNFTDPTGHKCVSAGQGDCLNAKGNPINGSNGGWQNGGGDLSSSNHPDEPDKITVELEGNALSLYNAYVAMWKDPNGWWWKKYGSGGFTIWDFMAVMWAYEQQGYQDTKKFAASLGNHAPGWCDYKGCDPSTPAGSLMYLGRFNQVGVARANNLSLHPDYSVEDVFDGPKGYWPGDSMQIVEAIQNNYFSGDPHAPYDVGNVSMRSKIYRKMAGLGMMDTVWGLPGQDRMVILTYCQWQMVNDAVDNGGAQYINRRVYGNYCGG